MANARAGLTSQTTKTRMIAAIVVLALLVATAVQLAGSAGAEALTITRSSAARDAMGVDYDRNGNAVSTKYQLANTTLSVGETPGDGHDARALVPFWITNDMLDVAKDGGTATASVKVWKVENLGARHVVLEAFTTDSVASTDFKRAATHLSTLTPAAGKIGVDVTSIVRGMPAKAYLVLRLRLDSLAPIDGAITRVTIGASEARVAANRPTISVASKVTAQSAPPTTTTTTSEPVPPEPTTPTTTAPEPPAPTPEAGAAGTTVGASRYPVPAGAIIVAPSGSDTAAGTTAAPLRTLTRAVAVAPSGSTIVLRAGSYHESVQIPSNRRLTVQAWPSEAVWMDGSSVVDDWTPSGGRWFHDNWTVEFDASPTYTRGAADSTVANWGFVNAEHPMAAYPDQIWIDGAAQRQVGSLAAVVPGTFFHDRPANRLWLGSDPTGNQVRVSDLVRALMIRSEDSIVRGLGIRRFAPSVPDMGAVTVERPGVVVENVAITDCATTGLHVGSGTTGDVTLRNLVLARNGMLGMNANNADRLTMDRILSEDNNTEHFNTAPVSGGAKIGRSRGVIVRDSVFRDNEGPGLWMDESVYDMTITGNEMRGNAKHGTSLELSAKAVFANNVVTNNGGYGIKINNTSDVAVWNNTFSGNDRSIFFTQDSRQPTSATTAGRDKRQPFPDPTMTWRIGPGVVMNNIIANQRAGTCMLCVEDATQQRSAAQMGVTANSNVYNRTAGTPATLVTWARTGASPAAYRDLPTFRAATGQEVSGQSSDGTALVGPDGDLIRALDTVAQPLPAAIAAVTGKATGMRLQGAWPR